ncbi:hypothetical protein JYU34_012091 [Plutella xylostella]|uniref:Nardilysin-like n=1 Tax=Plutella xylostella TaxID=51655 RepID=A0ABQ7QED0_PLUXY|nr:hypothetical protein JYU34_012091 [Plutella xylostella]
MSKRIKRTPQFNPSIARLARKVTRRHTHAKHTPHAVDKRKEKEYREKVEVLKQPIKSEADKKLYKTIRLHNGLTALLISDPTTPPPAVARGASSSEASDSGSESTHSRESSSGQSEDSDQHGSGPKRELDDEKLGLNYQVYTIQWQRHSDSIKKKWFSVLRKRIRQVKRYKQSIVSKMRPPRQRIQSCSSELVYHQRLPRPQQNAQRTHELSFDTVTMDVLRSSKHLRRRAVRRRGQLQRPARHPGLAHFVKHMVFMGSEKYPKENEFDAYISELLPFRDRVDIATVFELVPWNKVITVTIRLHNGLTALLISDPTTPPPAVARGASSSEASDSGSESTHSRESSSGQSEDSDQHGSGPKRELDDEKLAACALCVGVGSYSDPHDIQGLAHFVEHMVFMGSEKYPKENEFDAYIKKGGSDNASTDCEVTTFYFEIQERYLPRAMDMFSNFFVSPLMKKESMQREREAIQSEFAIAAPSDGNRKDQLLSSLFPEGHPARTFTWGNLKSLREEIGDDDKLHKAAHEFRKRHYSAHRMTLAVQARMDLKSLEKYVVDSFSHIPRNSMEQLDFSQHQYSDRLVTPEFTSLYYVKPISDASEIHLTWMMRSLLPEYQSKPHQYISFLLGHEGKGSLLSYLRNKVWAMGLYTGNSESGLDYTSMYSLFTTQIVLTKDGLEHVDEVLEAVFSYLEMLRNLGPSERIFKEIQTIESNSFRFEEEHQPADYVETLSENMHFYPPEHYITGDKLYYKYDPEGIMQLLEAMRPDKVNIMILSNKHSRPVHYNQTEKWFGTEYRKEDIPEQWLDKWMSAQPYEEFHLPEKNEFIATDFTLLPPAQPYLDLADEAEVQLGRTPARIVHRKMKEMTPRDVVFKDHSYETAVKNFRKNRHMEVWYKPDFKWRFPTALLYFYFITPLSLRSPRESCLLDLYNDVIHQTMKEELYPADMADLSHSLSIGDKGLMLRVAGYSQNLHLLVDLITKGMRQATEDVTPSLFEAVREVRARNYHNVLIKPVKLAKDVRMHILLEPYISPRHKAAEIHNVTLDELKEFGRSLFDRMYAQVLIQGNLHWTNALKISERAFANLKWGELDEIPMVHVHQLPLGSRVARVLSLNPHSTNSIVTDYYQAGTSNPKDTAILEVLMMLMEEPVFDALRTKEQLGYSVFSMMRYTFGVLGFSVTVNTQVDKFSVSHVDGRVENFLKKFLRDMRRLNESTLDTTKTSLIQLKHTTDYELKEEVERNWREISSQEYQFQRLYNEAGAISRVKLPELKAWVENHFANGNKSKFRKLSIQIMGHKAADTNSSSNEREQEPEYLHSFDLTFLDASDPIGDKKEVESNADFIKDIQQFKRDLPLMTIPKVELAQC